MGAAATNLRFSARYVGGNNQRNNSPPLPAVAQAKAVLEWDENEAGACFYRVERQVGSTWTYVRDVPKGDAFAHVVIGNMLGSTNVAGLTVTNLRVTCIGSGADGVATLAIGTHTPASAAATGLTNTEALVSNNVVLLDFAWLDASIWLHKVGVQLRRLGGSGQPFWSTKNSFGAGSSYQLALASWLTEGTENSFLPFAAAPSAKFNLSGVRAELYSTPVVGQAPNPDALIEGDTISVQIESLVPGLTAPTVTGFSFVYYRRIYIGDDTTLVATKDQAFSKNFATGARGTVSSWSSTSLPTGLAFDTGTGILSGTPTVAGDDSFTISATNPNGLVTTLNCVLHVNVVFVPAIVAPATAALTTLTAATVTLVATGNPSSFAIVSGTLPAGLTLNTTTGVISGTPTTAGTPAVGFSATNTAGTSATFTCTFTVTAVAPPTITSAATGNVTAGIYYSYQITASTSVYSYTVTGLPAGLALVGSKITGTVGFDVADGVHNVSIYATNASGPGPIFTLALTVLRGVPVITSLLTASGTVGSPFRYQIVATSVPTRYTVSILPVGLSIDYSTGFISGTPATSGIANIQIGAVNAAGAGTATLVLTIATQPVPVIKSATEVEATVDEAFNWTPSATNSPTNWSADPLPPGISFDPATGVLSGAFTTVGTYSVDLIASNAGGNSAVVTIVFEVEATPLQDRNTNLVLYVDVANKTLVAGPNSVIQAVLPAFMQGDAVLIDLYFLGATGDVFDPFVYKTYTNPTIRLGIGKISAPTGGTFTITWDGNPTAALAYNASAAEVEAALTSVGDFTVTGDYLTGYTITSTLTGAIAQITASAANLSPDSVAIIKTVRQGGVGLYEIQTLKFQQLAAAYTASWTAIPDSPGFTATLSLDTLGIDQMLGAAALIADAILEIELTPSGGTPETVVQQAVTVKNDLLENGVYGSTPNPSGVVAAPASAGAAGVIGNIASDTNYIYACVATNTWKRVAIAAW